MSEPHRCQRYGDKSVFFRSDCPACQTGTVPANCCPYCTKDLEADGWCFECRRYPRGRS